MKVACLVLPLCLLAACSAKTEIVYRTVVEQCPVIEPKVSCLPFPKRGETLREFLTAWEEAKSIHAECAASLEAWETSWEACGNEQKEK